MYIEKFSRNKMKKFNRYTRGIRLKKKKAKIIIDERLFIIRKKNIQKHKIRKGFILNRGKIHQSIYHGKYDFNNKYKKIYKIIIINRVKNDSLARVYGNKITNMYNNDLKKLILYTGIIKKKVNKNIFIDRYSSQNKLFFIQDWYERHTNKKTIFYDGIANEGRYLPNTRRWYL
jgi:hypothetical protein